MITLDVTTKPIKKVIRRAYVRRELMALGRILKFLALVFLGGYALNLIIQALFLFI